jgi:transcriptional regulator with XRE-family HTH domain
MKNKISISDNIRILRENLGFSQDYIASQLEITQQAYSGIEKNPEKTSLKRLKDIAAVLQVSVVSLIGEDETFILNNFHQQGGSAINNFDYKPSNSERHIYEKLIQEQKEEIVFLRELVRK